MSLFDDQAQIIEKKEETKENAFCWLKAGEYLTTKKSKTKKQRI